MISTRIVVFLILTMLGTAAYAQINVTTSLGVVLGRETTYDGNTFREFLGIPYAEPPVGNLRFARPKFKVPWTEELDATQFRSACPQEVDDDTIDISEDCLFLNIIVPPNASEANPVPVMLYIPDRGYRIYAGSEYIGREMAATGNIIVVTINYRFLTFGFFTTGDDCFPGNWGLWDQRIAIEWVRENIGPFGGDGSRITLVGQGRNGGRCIAAQVLSPLNNNQLFQRAIIQSSIFNDYQEITFDEDGVRMSNLLAENLQCNQTSWAEKIVCIRSKSWEDILLNSDIPSLGGQYYEIRVDGYFLPESLDLLLARDHIHQYDIIAGVVSDEGSLLLNSYAPWYIVFPTIESLTYFLWIQFVPRYGGEEKAQLAMDATEQQYFDPVDGLTDRDSAMRFVFDVFGDAFYISNTVNFVRRHQSGTDTNTFLYFFDYVDENFVLLPDMMEPVEPRDFTRAVPGEELFYLWDSIFGRNCTQTAAADSPSLNIRSNMIRYWTNFVNNGDPNVGDVPDVSWPSFDNETETYLLIRDNISTNQHLKPQETRFWLNYIPKLTAGDEIEACSTETEVPDFVQSLATVPNKFVVLNIADADGKQLGQVQGILQKMDSSIGGLGVRVFRGIPYTLSPEGERRFAYSEVLEDWGTDTFRNATELTPGCLQRPGGILSTPSFSEDCLHVNIFAPDLPDADPMPVIVYMHSGLYRSGNGVMFEGSTLASYAESVVVTLNYRLGALGFLSTGDSVAPGNYGIMDVVTALKWIKRYIGSFGGNPENVIALGMGSGAQIAHLISINGHNDGLMHKIMAFGDSVISPAVLTSSERDPLQYATRLAEALGCPTTTTREIVDCLRSKPAEDVALTDVGGSNTFFNSFYPVWDGEYLKDSPDNILASGDYETIPIILGATENDNTVFTAIYLNDSVPDRCPDEKFAGAIIDDVVKIFYGGNEEIASLFRMFYLESELSPTVPNVDCPAGQQVSEFLSDLWLNGPFLETGRLMAEFDKEVYLYFLTYHSNYHVYGAILPPWVNIAFGDDVPLAFGWPFDRLVFEMDGLCFNPANRKVAINFMNMISSFARTGIPSANPTDPDLQWLPYNTSVYNALFLDVCPIQQSIPRAQEKDTLWNSVIAGLKDSLRDDERPSSTPSMAIPDPCVVDGFLGLGLSAEQAGQVIGALIITIAVIAGLILLGILLKGCTRMSRKSNKPV